MGKHYNMNRCHVVILVEENILKSSSMIQVFTATTMNQDQKLTFHQKAQLHTTELKVAYYYFIYSELLHFGEQTGM
jgi:hypothetical protein